MPAISTSRRTPLGHAYAAPDAGPRFWSGPAGPAAHVIAGTGTGPALRLYDLTACDRFGLKGRGSADWLARQGLTIPERVNTWRPSPAQALDVLRLGRDDLVVLSRPDATSGAPEALRTAWRADAASPRGHDAWRDEVWAWFHLCGDGLADLMAMTCPVDLRPDVFATGDIVQSRVAQLDCVVARSDRAGTPGFDLFFDIASSAFVLASLKELGLSLAPEITR